MPTATVAAPAPEPAPHIAPDMPPIEKRKRGRPPGSGSGSRSGGPSENQITDAVATLYATIGTGIAFLNPYDGMVILLRADAMAKALVAACKPYPEAYRWLQVLARGNVWTVLFMAHIGPVAAIAANHGILPREAPTRFGLPEAPERSEPEYTPEQMAAAAEYDRQDAAARAAYMAAGSSPVMASEADIANLRGQVAAAMAANGANMPLGDMDAVAVRAAFTADQVDRIRQEAINNALATRQAVASNPDAAPPDEYNPAGGKRR